MSGRGPSTTLRLARSQTPLIHSAMEVSFEELSGFGRVLSCLGLATVFVLSLYAVDAGLSRNHPKTVRRRLSAIAFVCSISPFYLWLCSDAHVPEGSPHLLHALGVRAVGFLPAVTLSLLLVVILYIGPIFQCLSEGDTLFGHIINGRTDLNFRTYVFAPFAEELVFRACMLPVLVPWLGDSWSIAVCPLFFGLAHIHHIMEWRRRRDGTPIIHALFAVFVQFCYTSVFGMFSAYLFVRTGHLASPVVSHALCNAMGLPSFESIPSHPYKHCVGVAYILGLVCFLALLRPFTDPRIFT